MAAEMFWDKQIAVEEIGGVPFRMYTNRPHRAEQLLALADRYDERPHLIHADRVVSFAGLQRGSAEKARTLRDDGVRPGNKVLLLGWNSPDWVMNFWACIRIGAIPVLANAWWGEQDIQYALDLLKPALILADARCEGKISAPWRRGSWTADENAPADKTDPVYDLHATPPGEDETAVIIFTSGTEGRAKAVVLTYRALLSGLQMMLHITHQLPLRWEEAKSEISLHTGPLFHVGGPQVMLRSMAVGTTLVFPTGRFEPVEVLSLIEQHRVTRWTARPHHDQPRDRAPRHTHEGFAQLGCDRHGRRTGQPRSPRAIARRLAGCPAARGRRLRPDREHRPCDDGVRRGNRQISRHQRPAAASGRDIDRAARGIAGWRDPDPLADADVGLLRHGPVADQQGRRLHSGDLGKVDETGRLWITGRTKDIIIRGGENIAPASVEKALAALPEVAEVAVIGVPHPDLGEEVMAFVVLKREATIKQLQEQLRGSLGIVCRTQQVALADRTASDQPDRQDRQASACRESQSGNGRGSNCRARLIWIAPAPTLASGDHEGPKRKWICSPFSTSRRRCASTAVRTV